MSISVGAFVAAPVSGLMWGCGTFALRVELQWVQAKTKGHRFDAFGRPSPVRPPAYFSDAGSSDEEPQEPREHVVPISVRPREQSSPEMGWGVEELYMRHCPGLQGSSAKRC